MRQGKVNDYSNISFAVQRFQFFWVLDQTVKEHRHKTIVEI